MPMIHWPHQKTMRCSSCLDQAGMVSVGSRFNTFHSELLNLAILRENDIPIFEIFWQHSWGMWTRHVHPVFGSQFSSRWLCSEQHGTCLVVARPMWSIGADIAGAMPNGDGGYFFARHRSLPEEERPQKQSAEFCFTQTLKFKTKKMEVFCPYRSKGYRMDPFRATTLEGIECVD